MKVLKFGGSSVGSAEIIKEVKKLVALQPKPCVVVVSAFKGITDQIIATSMLASIRDINYEKGIGTIQQRHTDVVNSLIPPNKKEAVYKYIEILFNDFKDLLYGVYLLGDLTPKTQDHLLSFGERLSSFILTNILDDSICVDMRNFIRTDSRFGNAQVDFTTTDKLISEELKNVSGVIVAPGFIAANEKGDITTLGRGGSDYTAAIIAGAINAEILEIWTDVDGFMTADPRKVIKAYPINRLSYSEALELSHFGAKVIYTPTLYPAYLKNIPIKILNTFNPKAPGTYISKTSEEVSFSPIKGISSMDDIDMITIEGSGLPGVTGISRRLFTALASQNVNVILITQASSEYSISFAISPSDTEKSLIAIKEEFQVEMEYKKIIEMEVERHLSIIAIVGEKMKNTPGISAILFTSLGRNGISVIATAQGSSELNISVVIKRDQLTKALNVIHEGFFLSHYKELHLYLVGIGTVGKDLLKQISEQKKALLKEHNLKINLIGIARSKKMLIKEEGIDYLKYADDLEKNGEPTKMDTFLDKISALNLRNSVFIDCTGSEQVAGVYLKLFDKYVSVVTANKIACSSVYSNYKLLKLKAREKGVKFNYETNVGAGLPIINTINDLIRSGDHIHKFEAVLSGTLNFIFNALSKDISFSMAVKLAMEKGFSEPDPRIDLSGIDVMRKLLILSREAGYQIEEQDVIIKRFLPDTIFNGSLDTFWEKVKTLDEGFEEKRKKLEIAGKKWRFFARFENGKASVELLEVDSTHPAFSLADSNNIILITTERYKEQPMVIRGYGAGAAVTAAGVFADIIRIANV
jgi:bifunctional aspartokinase / homoserine dehydrogenase 1